MSKRRLRDQAIGRKKFAGARQLVRPIREGAATFACLNRSRLPIVAHQLPDAWGFFFATPIDLN
jgi:hypothetical protein